MIMIITTTRTFSSITEKNKAKDRNPQSNNRGRKIIMDKGREGGLVGEQVGERAQGGQLHETERSLRSKRRGARPLACRWCGLHQP